MAKIYSLNIKKEVTPVFNVLPDDVLLSDKLLTKLELELIKNSITESENVIRQCGPNDDDVLAWHEMYLTKITERLERSLLFKKRRAYE